MRVPTTRVDAITITIAMQRAAWLLILKALTEDAQGRQMLLDEACRVVIESLPDEPEQGGE